MKSSYLWLSLGFAGQMCFFMRFLIQWLASEHHKRSHIPESFWYLSLAGAGLVLIYAFYRKDPVFIAGQFAGMVVYTRNLVFIRREKKHRKKSGDVYEA